MLALARVMPPEAAGGRIPFLSVPLLSYARNMTDVQRFFSQLNQFFDKVFVITLQRATDRHQHIYTELQGLDYELFYGRDKQAFSVDDLEKNGIYSSALARRHHRYGKPMPPGMIGCAWSHAELYKTIVEAGYQKVLILEDDVVVDKKAVGIWPRVVGELPAGWELLYLGFAQKERVPPLAFFKKALYHLQRLLGRLNYSHKTIGNLYPKKMGAHLWKAGYHDCSHAYGITLAGAGKLLALQTPIAFFPDNLLAHAATNEIVNGFIVLPKIIYQQYQLGTTSVSYINQ